jgi:hypothetical protein
MMVHSRKAQILKRQMTQFRLGLLDGNFAGFDFFQQFFYLLCVNNLSLL